MASQANITLLNTCKSYNVLPNEISLNSLLEGDNADNTFTLCESKYLTLDEIDSHCANFKSDSQFLHINCRSLSKNFDSILSLIAIFEHSFTAIGVSETWLRDHNADIFKIPGYKFVSCNRQRKLGGGVGLFINDRCVFNVCSELMLSTEIIECIFIEIVLQDAKNFLIGCIYRPPHANVALFNAELSKIFKNRCFNKGANIFYYG